MDKQERKEIVKQGLKNLEELDALLEIEKLIKSNVIDFEIDGKPFRVRKPNIKEYESIARYRRKRYMELVDDDSFLFRKQWMDKYEKKGINIKEMENKIYDKQNNINDLLIKLAQTKIPSDIKTLKDEIVKLREEQFGLSSEKVTLLAYSVEDQLIMDVNLYTTYIVLEQLENKEWIKVFKTFDEFRNSEDSAIINRAIHYVSQLVFNSTNEILEEEKDDKKTKKTS